MPPRQRYRRRRSRRPNRRNRRYAPTAMRRRARRGGSRNLRVTRFAGNNLFPASIHRKLVFQDAVVVTIPSGLDRGKYTYYLNGLYDPEEALTGHQPRGFDQYSVFFNRYMVTGCKITVKINSRPENNTLMVVATADTTADVLSSALEPSAQEAVNNSAVSCWRYINPASQVQGHLPRMTYFVNMSKRFGERIQYAPEKYAATFGANPTQIMGSSIYLLDSQGGAVPAIQSVAMNVRLTFYVKFFDPKPIPQS